MMSFDNSTHTTTTGQDGQGHGGGEGGQDVARQIQLFHVDAISDWDDQVRVHQKQGKDAALDSIRVETPRRAGARQAT